jgi:hypothetical protein
VEVAEKADGLRVLFEVFMLGSEASASQTPYLGRW